MLQFILLSLSFLVCSQAQRHFDFQGFDPLITFTLENSHFWPLTYQYKDLLCFNQETLCVRYNDGDCLAFQGKDLSLDFGQDYDIILPLTSETCTLNLSESFNTSIPGKYSIFYNSKSNLTNKWGGLKTRLGRAGYQNPEENWPLPNSDLSFATGFIPEGSILSSETHMWKSWKGTLSPLQKLLSYDFPYEFQFAISNPFDYAIKINVVGTPFGPSRNSIRMTFNNTELEYIGAWESWDWTPEVEYVFLEPGQSVSTKFRLGYFYDISEIGNYTVWYQPPTEETEAAEVFDFANVSLTRIKPRTKSSLVHSSGRPIRDIALYVTKLPHQTPNISFVKKIPGSFLPFDERF